MAQMSWVSKPTAPLINLNATPSEGRAAQAGVGGLATPRAPGGPRTELKGYKVPKLGAI